MENFIHEDTDTEVQDLLRSTSKTTPQEAVKTIDRAEHYDMHPDNYDSMSSTLDPEVEIQERVPAQVSPSVKDYMQKSSKHAEVAKNEIGALEKVGRQASFIWYNLTEKHVLDREIQELNNRDRTSEKGLEEHEREYLNNLYDQQQEEIQAFGLEGFEQVPGQAAGVVNDMFQAVTDNKALIATSVGAGAGIGFFTPFGPATALAGAGAGLGAGITAALAKDAYFRIADSTFGELTRMKGDDGQPLNLSRDTMDNISMSVGAVSAALEAVTGRVLTKGLQKLIVPKTAVNTIVKNTALRTSMDILGHASKSAIASGGEETASEIASLVGENFAKGHNSEEGLLNAINQTIDDISNKPEVRKRLGITAAVGALAGGAIAGGTGAVAARKIKKGFDVSNEVIEKQRVQNATIQSAVDSITNQNDVMSLAAATVQTDLKKMSPEQMSELRKDMFTRAGYEDKIWFSEADMVTIEESNPELAIQIREMDATESSNNQTSSPVGLEVHNFMDLVDETPTISEFARLNPQAPNPLESKNLLNRFKDAEAQRREIFESLGVENQELTPEQVEILENLDRTVEEGVQVTGEEGLIESPTFTEGTESVIPPKQVGDFNIAQIQARIAVSEQMIQEFEDREIRIENKVVKANDKIEKEGQEKKIANDLRVVEHFKFDPEAPTPSHKKKGFSQLAIDPKFLPENLREAFVTDPKLIKRKVFVEGGITLDESAALTGVTSGEEMLKILANTPTKKELVTARKKKNEEIRKQVKESRAKSIDERRNKIFDDINEVHLREMKFMKEFEWPATKQGIKKIVLPLPRIEELNNTARNIVAKTKVGQLSPRQFNAGEKSLQRKAANHILKNEVEQAFIAKEKAMLNSELTRESLRARSQVNDAKQLVKRIQSKKGINTFKKANMLPQVTEILDLFNLRASQPKGVRQDSYFEYLATLDEQGKSIIVPESLNDIRARGTELTTQQYLRVTDRLKTLEHQARTKNRLLKQVVKREELNKIRTEESVVSDAFEDLETHPDYDTSVLKDIKNTNSKTFNQRVVEKFAITSAIFSNYKNIVTQLDREALLGKHHENLVQPLVNAETFKRTKLAGLVDQIKKISVDYGKKDFTNSFNEFIDIPEFVGYSELGQGTMAKPDLWTLFAYLGDPQARERIQNFINPETNETMSVDTVRRVLERELTAKDAKLAQNFVNIFKSFETEAKDLHERTTGVTPNMVKGVPIEFRGKVFDGGYVPNNYLNTSPTEKVERFLEVLGDKENTMFGGGVQDNKLYSRLRAAEMTDQGRLIDRNGSSRPLDTDFRNFLHAYEEHIHDIAYREAGTDVLKLLRNPVYSNAIRSTVGNEKFNTLGNAVIETVGRSHNEDTLNPFSKERKAAEDVYKWLEQGYNIKTLGFKWKSVAMQPLSFGAAALRMGPKGGRYLLKSFAEIMTNLHNYSEVFDAAAEINSDLLRNKDSVDDTLVKSTYGEIIPKTRRSKFSQKVALIKRGQQFLNDTSMLGLKKLDIHIKVATTLASYSQFMAGDVKAFPISKLEKMSVTEREVKARQYAKSVADLALTTSADIDKSAVEKISQLRIFTRFYTDLRSQLNTSTSQFRKIKNSAKQATTAFREGDITKGLSHTKESAIDVGSLLAIHTMSQMYMNLLQKEETPIDELANVKDMDDFKNFLGNSTSFILKAPVKGVIGSTIGARDIQFAYNSTRRKKKVNLPINQVFSDITMSITGLADLLEGEDLSKDQKKSMLATASYVGGGLPVNGPLEVLDAINESEVFGDVGGFVRREANRLASNIKKFSEDNKNNPEAQDTIEALKEIQTDIVPALEQDTDHIVPDDALEVMKLNEWDDQNPITGAAGVYQFTEERWEEVSENNPDLGLTENGRVSKDVREQEKAMNRSLQQNATGLIAYQIPVDNFTLYGAHRFGLDDFTAVMLSEDKEKLSGLIEDKKLFKGFKSVKQVKNFIKKKVKKNN